MQKSCGIILLRPGHRSERPPEFFVGSNLKCPVLEIAGAIFFFHWWCGHCGYYMLIRCICIYIYIYLHMVVLWVIVYKVIQCYNMIMGKMTVNDHGARAESCRVAERLCAPFVGAPVHGLRASNWHRRCGLMVIVDDIRSYWSEQEAGCVYPKQVLSSIQFTRNK